MAKRSTLRLTPLEAVIMDCVWGMSEATVRQVRQRLRTRRPMAYNTVLTVMRILREKGFLSSTRDGRSDVYRPRVSREQMGRRSLSEVMDRFYAGSATALVSELLDSEDLSPEDVRAIRREVDSKLHQRAGGKGRSHDATR